MSLVQCAAAAAGVFPGQSVSTTAGSLPLPVVMVAIGGAESGWNVTARGDYGVGGPNCGGYTSWGWLQIHGVHSAYLEAQTGSANPCVWASWLYDPAHCAAAALAVYQSQGLGAWSTYQDGRWRQYVAQASGATQASGRSAASSGQLTLTDTAGSGVVQAVNWPVVGIALLLSAGVAGIEVAELRRKAVR